MLMRGYLLLFYTTGILPRNERCSNANEWAQNQRKQKKANP